MVLGDNCIARAISFLLVEGAIPINYYQLASYYDFLISSKAGSNTTEKMRMRSSPIPLIYSSNAQMLLIATHYPKPDATYNSSRIAQRDINQLKAFVLELEQFEALGQQARMPAIWNSTIGVYENATIALHTEIGKVLFGLEKKETLTIHGDSVDRLNKQHTEEQNEFNKDIEAATPEWVIDDKWQEWFKGNKHIHKNWYKYRRFKKDREGSSDSDEVYKETERRRKYLDQQNKFMRDAKEEWNIRIGKFQERAADNHLSTTAPANISAYHGARFLKSTQPNSPYLPAPDPLLSPTNQSTFEEFMHVLKEAQAYDLGDIELFYTTFSETRSFVLDIVFHHKTPSAYPNEAIASFNITYDPIDGYPRPEAIWKSLVGISEFVRPRQGNWEYNKGGGCTGGDDNYHCEHFETSLFVPKPPEKRVGLLELWQQGQFQTFVNEIHLTLRNDLLNGLRSAIEEARQEFTILIRERLSNSLDHKVQNNIGRLCHAFEEAYHHLFGILVYAFSDEMQNPKSDLRIWFRNHAANIQQLRQTLTTEAIQFPLRKLIADLPKLRAILSDLPTQGVHFHLLSDTRAALQGFLQLYEPYAVAHNTEVPFVDMDEKVKERYNHLLLNALTELFNNLPYEQAVKSAQKILDKDIVTDNDRLVRDEILQRLQDESKQRGLALPAPTLVPQLSETTPSPTGTAEESFADDDDQEDPTHYTIEKEPTLMPGYLPFASAAKIIPIHKTSAAPHRVSMSFYMLPLHMVSPVITTSFSSIKTLGRGLFAFVKTSWEQFSSHSAESYTANTAGETPPVHFFNETKNNSNEEQQNNPPKRQKLYMDSSLFRLSRPQPTSTLSELGPVAIALANKTCERQRFFGHKQLTAAQINDARSDFKNQIEQMESSLNKMLQHSILKRRGEVQRAQKAILQAQSRFKKVFKNTPHIKVTQSQQADLKYLFDIAHQHLEQAKTINKKVLQSPELVDAMMNSDGVLKKAEEILHEIRSSFTEKMQAIKYEKQTLNKKFMLKKITELTQKYQEMELEENLRSVQENYEAFEAIESALDSLIAKIRPVLDAGQFEQLDAVQADLTLVAKATEYLLTEPDLLEGEHDILQSVLKKVNNSHHAEIIDADIKPLEQVIPAYSAAKLTDFWMPAEQPELLPAQAWRSLARG